MFADLISIPFRCLHPADHDGDHQAWVGMRRSYDLFWSDDGVELVIACGYRDAVVLQ